MMSLQIRKERVAIYPGSFDPVTMGHMDIIRRAAKQFDRLIVTVLNNLSKNPMFSVEERTELLRQATADIPNVEVDSFRDLLVNYLRQRMPKSLSAGSARSLTLNMNCRTHPLIIIWTLKRKRSL